MTGTMERAKGGAGPRFRGAIAVALFAMALGGPLLLLRARRAESRPLGVVTGRVIVKTKGIFGQGTKSDRSGVVVYLENVPGRPAALAPPPALRQVDKTFAPRVLAVSTGATVVFPNEDKIFHNVFSLSETTKFDLGLYKSGVSKSVMFERPGVIDVYCNIHPEMVASIKVLDSFHFIVTEASGAFRIGNVPPGTYPIVAWMPRSAEVRSTVTVPAEGAAQVVLELLEGSSSSRHLRKDETPYGRYE